MPISIDEFASHPGGTSDTSSDRVHFELGGVSFDVKEEAATGVLFGVVGLTSTMAAVAVSPLGQRLGYRNTVGAAAVLTGVLYLPVALAPSYTGFVLLMGAVGLFQGAMVPGTNALIAASTPHGKQGSAFGLAASMQSLALLVGPIGGGFVGALLGIQAVYVVIGVILILASFAAYLFIREPELFEATSVRRASRAG
jgi:MFS family permease